MRDKLEFRGQDGRGSRGGERRRIRTVDQRGPIRSRDGPASAAALETSSPSVSVTLRMLRSEERRRHRTSRRPAIIGTLLTGCHAKRAFHAKIFSATLVALALLGSTQAPVERAVRPRASSIPTCASIGRPTGVRAIRFLTTDDYPPLNFALADGSPAGFNVDRPRDLQGAGHRLHRPGPALGHLIDSLMSGKGDAVVGFGCAVEQSSRPGRLLPPLLRDPGPFRRRKGRTAFLRRPRRRRRQGCGRRRRNRASGLSQSFFPAVAGAAVRDPGGASVRPEVERRRHRFLRTA